MSLRVGTKVVITNVEDMQWFDLGEIGDIGTIIDIEDNGEELVYIVALEPIDDINEIDYVSTLVGMYEWEIAEVEVNE